MFSPSALARINASCNSNTFASSWATTSAETPGSITVSAATSGVASDAELASTAGSALALFACTSACSWFFSCSCINNLHKNRISATLFDTGIEDFKGNFLFFSPNFELFCRNHWFRGSNPPPLDASDCFNN